MSYKDYYFDELLQILNEWKEDSGVNTTMKFGYSNGKLTVYSSQCGFLVGRMGQLIGQYKVKLKKCNLGIDDLELVEFDSYDI